MNPPDGTRATILLVEDDSALANMLMDRLGQKAYCVWHASSASEAEAIVDEVRPDLIIVDLMLPDIHGLLLCARLKERQAAPIIICSGTKRKDDAALGLKLGAEDFIAKPFSVDELEARIERSLRRTLPPATLESPPSTPVLRVGDLVIDQARCRVALAGKALHLTPTEYRLLRILASRPDHVLSQKELAESVWGHHDRGLAEALGVHIRRLRTKLQAEAAQPPRIVAVRGFGYQLESETAGELLSSH